MKKKHINLFTQDFNSETLIVLLSRIKSIAIPLLILSIFAIFLELVGLWYVGNQTARGEATYQTLSTFIQSNSNFDRKIKYFIYKKNLVNTYLKEDAQGSLYYEKLKTILADLAPFATLVNFEFDNTKVTHFTVTFISYEDLLSFLNIIESKNFLENFTYVTVSEFSPSESLQEGAEIQLNIQVQFIEENGKSA